MTFKQWYHYLFKVRIMKVDGAWQRVEYYPIKQQIVRALYAFSKWVETLASKLGDRWSYQFCSKCGSYTVWDGGCQDCEKPFTYPFPRRTV